MYGICQNSVGIGLFSRFSYKLSCDKLMRLPRPGGIPWETIYVRAKVNQLRKRTDPNRNNAREVIFGEFEDGQVGTVVSASRITSPKRLLPKRKDPQVSSKPIRYDSAKLICTKTQFS